MSVLVVMFLDTLINVFSAINVAADRLSIPRQILWSLVVTALLLGGMWLLIR
jgi:hypothetical protein